MSEDDEPDAFERLFDEIAESMGISLFGPSDLGGVGFFQISGYDEGGNPIPISGGSSRKCDIRACKRMGTFRPIGETKFGLCLCRPHFRRYRDSAYRKIIEK